ncbi:MAG TPA: class II fructose-1,6-bisphosphate aldolase [Acholeplasmataceae bacterium]|nr:class II fructose-1,6-bisphosphate aldolase [Acholeplasmataceae bacterium]HQC30661.1 class II fructose-1,6-bisphosphate aldolase [Acholeplasmataceae bacterium]
MMLVSAKDMLKKAHKEGYAVAQININNLEWTQLVLKVAEELKSPVILGVSEGAAKYMGGFRLVMAMVRELHNSLKITVPVAVHLDHGTYEGALNALEAGFTSIMYDGSSLPFEENLKKTKEIVKLCHAKGVSVEAEVGSIGGEEDGVIGAGELADLEESRRMSKTGIDMFAAGIGNIHGPYPANWKGLNFERLREIQEVTGGIPLVLHGGTGIPVEMIQKSISLGVSKINVNTELQQAFAAATRKYIEDGKDLQPKGYDPRKLLKPGVEAAANVVRDKFRQYGSVNKA